MSPLELELISILDNFSFHNLSEEEKNAIPNQEDYPIISIINGLWKTAYISFDMIDKVIHIPSKDRDLFHQYLSEERVWVNDFEYYYGQNHKDITDAIHTPPFCEEFKKSDICKRYRLYFAAKHPDKIKILKEWDESKDLKKSEEASKKINAFLSLVKEEMRLVREGKVQLDFYIQHS